MGMGNSMESTVAKDISGRFNDGVFVIPELPQPSVAWPTEQASDDALAIAGMAVVNFKNGIFGSSAHRSGIAFTDGALAALLDNHAVVVGDSESVSTPQLAGANFGFPIFHEMSIHDLLHVWEQWVGGSARNMSTSITGSDMSVHPTEVKEFSAVSARFQPPCAGTMLNCTEFWNSAVVIEPPPVVLPILCAWFALVGFSAWIRNRYGKVVDVIDLLANRANMLVGGEGRRFITLFKVALEKSLMNKDLAKGALDLLGSFHLSLSYQKISRYAIVKNGTSCAMLCSA